MRAILVQEFGGPEVLRLAEVAEPVAGEGELLVDVLVAGVNHFDLNQRIGAGGVLPFIPGADAVGVVRESGERVLITGTQSCYAEVIVAHPERVWLVPDGVSDEAAVALGVPYRTAWAGLVDQGELTEGQRLLVQAGASSTGQAAIDIGLALEATVFATTSPNKLDRIAARGAHALPYDDEELPRLEADVVFDPVGGETFGRSVESLGRGGIVVTPGAVGDMEAHFNIWTLVARNGRIAAANASTDIDLPNQLLQLAASGDLNPQIDSVLPLDQAAEAHRRVEARETFGKVVLRVR